MTLEEVREIAGGFAQAGTDDYNAAIVLLASACVGPNIVKLAKFTRISREIIRPWSRNLRANGVWVRDEVHHGGWDDEDPHASFVAFGLDVLVARGMLKRISKE